MGGSVESVTPNLVPPVKLVRYCVQIGCLWHCGVKTGVEHRDLRHTLTQEVDGCANTVQVCGIVKRGQLDAVNRSPKIRFLSGLFH